ncbi:MAG: peptidoglycan recognition family protein [Bacillota bacterium]|jgi:N-acetylmuramoyl-L-alanine amidase
MPKWSYIILHHTGAEEKNIEQIRRYHKSLGWHDIGYHYVIERDGTIKPGRSLDLTGAHCKANGMNYKGIGISLIGNFEKRRPYPKQLAALQRLLRELQHRYNIPENHIQGHNQVPGASTRCPGRLFSRTV